MRNQMRIGMLAAGIWRSVHLDVAKALRRSGNEVHVFTEDQRLPTVVRLSRVEEDGVSIWGIHHEKRNPWVWLPDKLLKPFLGGRRFFTSLIAIANFIARTRCDIYMVEGDGLGKFVALLAPFMGIRWVLCVHDHENLGVTLGYPGEPTSWLKARVKKWVFSRADGLRANSRVTRDVMIKAGIGPERITVIPLHCIDRMLLNEDMALFRAQARTTVIQGHGLQENCRIALIMCRLTPFKGIELAIQGFALAAQASPEAVLLVCGGDRQVEGLGSYRQHLEGIVRELKLDAKVIFTGNIESQQVKQYYAAADLHLVPSWIETFNYSAVEAALLGTRTLMTDKIGSGAWLSETGAAIVLNGRGIDAFGGAMSRLLMTQPGTDEMRTIAQCTERVLNVDESALHLLQWFRKHAPATVA